MRVAAVDIGTNSTRLLIADYKESRVIPVYQALEMTRIGEGVGVSGIISQQALERTVACVAGFIEKCVHYNVIKVRIVATSAVRDAQNKKQVVDAIYNTTGYNLEILTGEEEGKLSYLGAVSDNLRDGKGNYAVIDIGGGSTEISYWTEQGIQYRSVNLGAVRVKEGLALMGKMDEILADFQISSLREKVHFVGVGGTITTLAAIKLKMIKYDPALIHGQILTKEEISKIYQMLSKLELKERKKIAGLQQERADIITYGTYILLKIMDKFKIPQILVSEKDILHGLIISGNS